MTDGNEEARLENPANDDDGVEGKESPAVDALTAEFDDLLARMQAPGARAAMRNAMNATPGELGRAAHPVDRECAGEW
ncbi:MAG TPA: hypothetical protein VE871_02765 [Longimicrobium sp.]|nr:hypothetical protein [Longimicrobium sp.]